LSLCVLLIVTGMLSWHMYLCLTAQTSVEYRYSAFAIIQSRNIDPPRNSSREFHYRSLCPCVCYWHRSANPSARLERKQRRRLPPFTPCSARFGCSTIGPFESHRYESLSPCVTRLSPQESGGVPARRRALAPKPAVRPVLGCSAQRSGVGISLPGTRTY
jgi:hypothetical protein